MASAWLYDFFMAPMERTGLARARRRLVRDLSGRVLELGAGTGLLFRWYDSPPAAAVDVDGGALLRAARRDGRVPLLQADAAALPFPDAAFDAVVVCLCLCSIPDAASALAEARRVLRPGGELRLLEHVRPPGSVLGPLFDWLTPAWRRISGGCHLDRRTGELVAAAGFETTKQRLDWRGVSLQLVARR
ncbi:MAG TPA: methyltransferase domain-containing protein [Myxococcales bacterium]|nr:methyltransferase domain-containing protein [Myxococcales bacterium]